MKKILSLAALATFLLSGAAQAATLVLDGNFANTLPTFMPVSNGGTIGPWSVTSGSVDLIGGYWQAPSAGGGSVDLDGNNPGSIQQTFVAPTGNYVLDFSLSGNPDGPVGVKSLQVSIGGVTQDFTYNVTGANARTNMLYVPESVKFSSTGGPVTLSFLSLDSVPSSFGPIIGDVSVSAVPLPASLVLFGSGLVGLLLFARRRTVKI